MTGGNQKALLWAVGGLGGLLAVRALARRLSAYDFRDQVVLVTGGSRGLGLVLARQLVGAGAFVAVCARDEEELARARADLEGRGGNVLTVACDVTDRAQVETMVRTVREHWGRIDVLINNAGAIAVGPMEVMNLADYEEMMRVHFWGPLYTTLAVLPEMKQRQRGRIVNISSIGGKISVPHLLPYSASKFALVGLSEGLSAELAKDGIVVTTVCPGLMRTGSPVNAQFKGRHREEFTWFSISDALPLLTISAEHAARSILDACRRGEAEAVLSLPAQVATAIHGVFPGLTADVLGWVNRLLPPPGGIGQAKAPGRDSTSSLSPSWVTTLNDRAAERNNENPQPA